MRRQRIDPGFAAPKAPDAVPLSHPGCVAVRMVGRAGHSDSKSLSVWTVVAVVCFTVNSIGHCVSLPVGCGSGSVRDDCDGDAIVAVTGDDDGGRNSSMAVCWARCST